MVRNQILKIYLLTRKNKSQKSSCVKNEIVTLCCCFKNVSWHRNMISRGLDQKNTDVDICYGTGNDNSSIDKFWFSMNHLINNIWENCKERSFLISQISVSLSVTFFCWLNTVKLFKPAHVCSTVRELETFYLEITSFWSVDQYLL